MDLNLEGHSTPAVNVYSSLKNKTINNPSLTFEEHPKGKIYRISVYESKFRTKNGIAVGQQLGDLRKKLKGNVEWGEGNILYLSQDFTFALEYDAAQYLKQPKPPDSTKIRSILIFGGK